MLQQVINTNNSKTTILVRLMVGVVFLSEGMQKFLFPETLGSGRFAKIGLPLPEYLGSFVGFFEILCGVLILIGLYTRLAAIPIIMIMVAAIAATKTEILKNDGIWKMLHESRTDWAMLLGAVFLLVQGAGKYSIDKILNQRWQK